MTKKRLWYTIRLWMLPGAHRRTNYLKQKKIFAGMGENCSIMDRKIPLYANLIRFGDNVHLASGVLFCTHDITHVVIHGLNRGKSNIQERLGCIEIKDNVFIGSNTTILYDTKIGPNAVVAAGSVVVGDVPENSVVAGVPAKVVGSFEEFVSKRITEELYPGRFKPERQIIDQSFAEWLWKDFYNRHKDGSAV